jgi:serine/threonine-protein kinase
VSFAPETTFNNRYRIVGQLGNGGMAIVYRGTDTLLRRGIAIKVLRDQYATDDDFVQRFSYEAQSAAKLSHPNIVGVYDFGREDNAYYIVMELVEGSTLGELLREGRGLPEPVAVEYAVQIASGLAYAHRQGLLHRDVKPANILVTGDDVVKLSDFGIARAVSEHTLGVTQPGMVMGSVAYISPEQAQGKDLDERSDLYSVGVVLYQMLTGTLPFTGETPVAVALKHVSEPVPPIDTAALGVSPAIAAIVAKLLRKDPADRYSSATELASALRERREPGVGDAFADAATSRFGAVAQPRPRPSASPDRAAGVPAYEEVTTRRGFDARWVIIPLLFVIAIAAGYFALHGSTIFAPAKDIALPALEGTSETVAQQKLLNLGLQSTVTSEKSETVAPDRVLRETPPAGTMLGRGDTVELVVSGGLPQVQIPDIRGYSLPDAQKRLSEAKLENRVLNVYDPRIPAGEIVSVMPPVSTSMAEHGIVALTVSKGPQPISVPNLVGKHQETAAAALKARGLVLDANVQQAESDDVPAGTIMSQDPEPDAQSSPGGSVTITVSTGPPQVALPNIVGQDPDAARQALQAAGFTVKPQYAVDQNATEKVTAQDPPAGGQARKKTVVTITISVPGTIPDVTGMGPDDAKRALTAAGYTIGNTSCVQQPDAKDGAVVRTEPAASTPTNPGESVVLYLNLSGTTCP